MILLLSMITVLFFVAAVLVISQFEASVSEGDEMAEVCVSIDRPIISDVTFTLTPSSETALGKQIHTYIATIHHATFSRYT